MAPPYTVVVPFDDSPGSREALWKAVRLVSLVSNARFIVLHVTCLNAPARVPGLDNVEKAGNSEIRRRSTDQASACKAYLTKLDQVKYEWYAVEGQGTPGPIIETFIKEKVPECDIVVMGTRGLTGLKKVMLGSVSEYCVAHLPCPVAVVRPS